MEAHVAAPVSFQRRSSIQTAAGFARRRHAGQRLSDGRPFFEHVVEVADLLYSMGADDDVVTAGMLHDVLEKTTCTEDELRGLFGPRVTDLVVAVSDDDSITDWRRRKAAVRSHLRRNADPEELMLFAADKVSRIRELRLSPTPPAEPPTRRDRMAHYNASLHMLERCLPGSPLVHMLHAEVAAYSPRPAASAAAIASSRSR